MILMKHKRKTASINNFYENVLKPIMDFHGNDENNPEIGH